MSNKTFMIIQSIGRWLAIILSACVFFITEEITMKMLATAIYLKTLSDNLND